MVMTEHNWKPPQEIRDFGYWITKDAVNGIRNHLSPENKSKSDVEVAKIINRLVSKAFEVNDTVEVVDSRFPSVKTVIAHLQPSEHKRCYGVMRINKPNQHPPLATIAGPGGIALAVITVISDEAGTDNFASGKWAIPEYKQPEESGGKVVRMSETAAGQKLRELRITSGTGGTGGVTKMSTSFIRDEPVVLNMGAKCYRKDCTDVTAPNNRACRKHIEEEAATKRDAASKQPPRPSGSMSTEKILERENFVRMILRQRPYINYAGHDGIESMLKKTFGVGMSQDRFNRIRSDVQSEVGVEVIQAKRGGNREIATMPAPLMPIPVPDPTPHSPMPVVHAPIGNAPSGNVMAMAVELAAAIEAEKTAKQKVVDLRQQLEEAERVLTAAAQDRQSLFAKMQGI